MALFNLHSETINKSDIGYFFGSIAIAVITSIEGSNIVFVLAILVIVLLVVYWVDNPRFFKTSYQLQLSLDYIPQNLFAEPDKLKAELSERLGVSVTGVRLLNVNYVTEIVKAEITYQH